MKTLKFAGLASTLAISALVLSACGGQTVDPNSDALAGAVVADGSSTVAPLTEAAADLFRDVEAGVNVTVATSGTGGGFEKFCAGETDLSNASRGIKDEEAAICAENGIEFTEIIVANDGLAVVVPAGNDFVQCLTVEQLNTIWGPEAEGTITSWNQVDPSFPDVELALFGPGTDSGTFDYFTKEINGEEGAIRTDYSPSEDDNVLVQGIAGAEGGLGFFGLSYVTENADLIRAVAVDGGNGCVDASEATVQDGSYTPLGRPLYVYVNNASYAEKPQVKSFVDFYIENQAEVAALALYIGLTDEQVAVAKDELATLG
ncbi:phosphate ABC transporter substrate-binding protein (PhoT family) [Microbacteriaceae bacterium MWH-Ta3]|nr:phosphate ABC transporter substrate-binding protein (PhoT family) [Microbacteriaceae bacterium MWH-Ta3]